MKNNKAFQFCVGLFVLFLGWKLWETGWVQDAFGPKDPEAVESVDLVAMFISSAIAAVQMVGVVALGLIAGLQPLAVSFMESLTKWRKPATAGVDQDKLTQTLQSIVDRLDSLEKSDDGKD
jgi:hypothetical protein